MKAEYVKSKVARDAIDRINTKIEYLENEIRNSNDDAKTLEMINFRDGLKAALSAIETADIINQGAQ